MTLQNEGESIKVIVLNKGHENAILYFGGNAESMATVRLKLLNNFLHLRFT